ncbi:unnamed protein product [Cochlearia groenlandica]
MEFDLNTEIAEVEEEEENDYEGRAIISEKGKLGIIISPSSSSSCSSGSSSSTTTASASSSSSSSIYSELWHACAGPLTSLPKKGNVIVYLPQGHLEQDASSYSSSLIDIPRFEINPQIFCRVVNVQLLANKETDEVYTQVTLLPLQEFSMVNAMGKEVKMLGGDEERNLSSSIKRTPHMFCKTLTASDTSTHGGFSVPRRAAEDCFAPLDYKQQRPSQELIAKDLHGVEWKFRHIYRGQPRRHLLTTGWSIFVSQKNLVSGDAVLFLRDEDGELRLGIRRAARPRNGLPDSIIEKNSSSNILSLVANAVSTKTMFHVFYSPRATHAEFVIPYEKYITSIRNPVCISTRFRMRFEMDDSPERRCGGVVTGVCDLDPYRWPNSKWRCLLVRWDESFMSDHQERVSPWEIDPSVSLPPLTIQSSPRPKRPWAGLMDTTPPGNPITERGGFMDFEESVRSSKVLQGQENIGSSSPLQGFDVMNRRILDFTMQQPHANPVLLSSRVNDRFVDGNTSLVQPGSGVMDLDRFPRVLQGQEICSLRSFPQFGGFSPAASSGKGSLGYTDPFAYQANKSGFYPLALQGIRSTHVPYQNQYNVGENSSGRTSHVMSFGGEARKFDGHSEGGVTKDVNADFPFKIDTMVKQKRKNFSENASSGCKLFGFSLPMDAPAPNPQTSSKRICTKVHKQGSLVGRAIDLSRLNGYNDLLTELERLFDMEGILRDPEKGWRILYTDSENDMMVVGDDPWHDFCNVVWKIHLYTKDEVENANGDNKSCLEQAALMMEASKSSSVSQPDSSPTVTRV